MGADGGFVLYDISGCTDPERARQVIGWCSRAIDDVRKSEPDDVDLLAWKGMAIEFARDPTLDEVALALTWMWNYPTARWWGWSWWGKPPKTPERRYLVRFSYGTNIRDQYGRDRYTLMQDLLDALSSRGLIEELLSEETWT